MSIIPLLLIATSGTLEKADMPLDPGRDAYPRRPPVPDQVDGRTARGTVPTSNDQETVVLLHGLTRSSRSMRSMADALRCEGYTVITCDYPSRSADIATLTTNLFAKLSPQLKSARKVHFVTHSLGGVLLRTYLQDHALPNLGRVVMLGPPNGGSEVVDKLGSLKLYQWINGPTGNQLGTDTNSVPLRLRRADFELGVIAGDRSVNPILSCLIPGKDDGKVSVVRAKTDGMRDFICLHVTHTFMMSNRRAITQTKHFLNTGTFKQNRTEQTARIL